MSTFKPAGLAPQKVVDVDGVGDSTRDTYQRKVWFDGANFFVVYWESDDLQVKYVASADGTTWTVPVVLWSFGVGPYYGGNIDVQIPNRGALSADGKTAALSMFFVGSNGASVYWYPFTVSNQTLTMLDGGSATSATSTGGSVTANLNGSYDYFVYHRNTPNHRINRSAMTGLLGDATLAYGGTATGGCKILPYKTADDYDMMVLAKDASNKLYYRLVDEASQTDLSWIGSWTEIASLAAGYSDWCACSEAQNLGDPEVIHMVYVKSTGELCYRRFENDVLGDEKVLEASGASYPVIACGDGGKLYVFYVKNGEVWVIHRRSVWFKAVPLFTDDHTYDTPAYLSSNQNVQTGLICLVWTEGSASPYEVWFCYLED